MPGLPWVWGIVGAVFLVYLVLNLIFNRSVGAVAETLAARPLTAFAAGLLVLLLTGPVCLPAGRVGHRDCGRAVRDLRARRGLDHREGGRGAVDRAERPAPGIAGTPTAVDRIVRSGLRGDLCRVHDPGARLRHLGDGRRVRSRRRDRSRSSRATGGSVLPRVPACGRPFRRHRRPLGAGARPVRTGASSRTKVRRLAIPDAAASAFSPSEAPAVPAVASDLASFPRAAFRDRLAAFVLDVILVRDCLPGAG